MKTFVAILIGVTFVVGGAQLGFTSCLDDDPDGSKVAAARATAEQQCADEGKSCTTATSHGAYVSCIAHKINDLAKGDTPSLPPSCKGAAKRCAAKSVCGKQDRGFTTCCITNATTGETKCKIKHSTDLCTDAGGSPSTCGSCCDACPSGAGPTCPVM